MAKEEIKQNEVSTTNDNEVEKPLSKIDLQKLYGINPGEIAEGTEGIGVTDVIMPRLYISQKSSNDSDEDLGTDRVPLGATYNSVTKDIYSLYNADPIKNQSVDIVFLKGGIGRAMFGLDKKLRHRSDDAIHCSTQLPRRDGITLCKDCPDGQWGAIDAVTGKQKKPNCPEGYTYLVLVMYQGGFEGPFFFTMKSSVFKLAKKLNSEVKFSGLHFYDFIYTLRTFKDNVEGNIFWVPVITKKARIPHDHEFLSYIRGQFEMYKSTKITGDQQVSAEDVSGIEDDGTDEPY